MNKKESRSLTIAIMSIFFLMAGIGAITPGLQSIADAFPTVPFNTILLANTLPSLFIIPASFLAGTVAGSRIKYRTLILGGILLFTCGGAAPIILDNFTLILVTRAIFGIGLGLITPLGNALILNFFEGQARANLLGAGNVSLNAGGIVLQLLGGFLAAINWRYTFLSHLFGLISLVIVYILLKEPEKVERPAERKTPVPKAVYFYSLLLMLMFLFTFPLMLSMSSIISEEGLGDASAAAVVLSMFTVGGTVAGLVF
ncbi:MAG TPA: MFS transporter, partial [Firmicutes bacterium]|nr:MFS transporter [Bacillota bacterium]